MGYYLLQWAYKDPQIKAMIDRPQDRTEAARKVIEAFQGTLHHFFFAFGEYDGAAIAEFPDNESATASLLTIAGGGGMARMKTTVLITAAEAERAMRMANSTQTGYTPPAG